MRVRVRVRVRLTAGSGTYSRKVPLGKVRV